jgi:hemoglobin/transferrin/lactoferrin receptor protein
LIVPNPNINPEKTANYELSVSKTIKNKYRIGITGWYTNYTNALTTDLGTLNGSPEVFYNNSLATVYTVVNKNKANLYGINANAAGDINDHISFNTSWNYTYGRIKRKSQ